jgi:hypothetical protein
MWFLYSFLVVFVSILLLLLFVFIPFEIVLLISFTFSSFFTISSNWDIAFIASLSVLYFWYILIPKKIKNAITHIIDIINKIVKKLLYLTTS